MIELVYCTLLLAAPLLALHLPLRVRAEELRRAARTAPELRLRPKLAVAASRASLAMLVAAFAPLAGTLCGLADAESTSVAFGAVALASLCLTPLLLAISGLATPGGLRSPLANAALLVLLVLAFGIGLCTFMIVR